MVDLFDKCNDMGLVTQIREMNLYPYFHQISSRQHSEVLMDGRRTIMLGSNNYLGLTSDDRVIAAAKDALDRYGSGCSGSRFLNGTLCLHVELEDRLAKFLRKESVITFSTGFQTNLGIISAICDRHDVIFTDRLNHASIFDATRLSFAKVIKFDHSDMAQLEQLLAKTSPDYGKLIVVDGVFSMEGDVAPLDKIVALAKKYVARTMVDDSHGIGVLGENGRGTAEYFGVEKDIDILMGTFSKSFASLGGFMAADAHVTDYIKHTSRPFIFSASMPPSNLGAALEALNIIETDKDRIHRVMYLADYMRKGFKKLDIPYGDSIAPIIPIYTNDTARTLKITHELLERGVYVNPVFAPAVPEGTCLLRTSYISTHTKEQLDFSLDMFDTVFHKLGI